MIGYSENNSRIIVSMLLALFTLIATTPPASSAPPTPIDSVDLRPIFEKWKLPVRAQGDRGTCSIFTVAAAIEYALAEDGRRTPRLSIEFLNWASNQTTGRFKDGSFFSDLWEGFQAHGVCPEQDMPYQEEFDPKLRPSPAVLSQASGIRKNGLRLHWIKEWDPNKGLTEDQFAAVKDTLRKRKPVCGGFLWPKKTKWVDKVLQMAPRDGVRDGHSVLLVGFREDRSLPGGGVFLMHNTSKGPRQGAMSFEYVRAYMNDAAWVGPADVPSSN